MTRRRISRLIELGLARVVEGLSSAPNRANSLKRTARRRHDAAELWSASIECLYRLWFALVAERGARDPNGLTALSRRVARIAGDDPIVAIARVEESFSARTTALDAAFERRLRDAPAMIGFFRRARTADRAPARLSDRDFTIALDALAREVDPDNGRLRTLDRTDPDVRAAESRTMAALFEQLQQCRLARDRAARRWRIESDRSARRASGSYYTPTPLVACIMAQTVDAAWRDYWAARADLSLDDSVAALSAFRVVDPACGGGDFLLAALDFLALRASALLSRFPRSQWRSAIRRRLFATLTVDDASRTHIESTEVGRLDDTRLVRLFVAVHSIYGVDLDRLAVELCRARLWLALDLDVGQPPSDWLLRRLRCGNSLLDEGPREHRPFDWRRSFPEVNSPAAPDGGFQAIVGNPPYGATRDARQRRELLDRWPQMRHNSDAVVGFVGRACEICAPQGRIGLVVPKPLTYSFAWRRLRETLYDRIDYVIDVSRAWPDVLLEQVLLGLRSAQRAPSAYRCGELYATRLANRHRTPRATARRYDVVLGSLTPRERRALTELQTSELTVGSLCRTFRGLPLQRRLGERGQIAVVGGRDLARWNVRGASGYLAAPSATLDLAPFDQEKLVFQNIVAHIANPAPHIRLIGAFDAAGRVTLDTVNNLVPRTTGVDLWAVLALLHSRPVNWFVYAVVYNKAIRTMHFDQYFLDKIPLPRRFEAIAPRLAELSQAATQALNEGDAASLHTTQAEIDRLVASAYGLGQGMLAGKS